MRHAQSIPGHAAALHIPGSTRTAICERGLAAVASAPGGQASVEDVPRLWASMLDGAPLIDLLHGLMDTHGGSVFDLPEFVVAVLEDGELTAAVRGSLKLIVDTDEGMRTISAPEVLAWEEVRLRGVRGIGLELTDSGSADTAPLPVASGVVAASSVALGSLAEGSRKSSRSEAPSSDDEEAGPAGSAGTTDNSDSSASSASSAATEAGAADPAADAEAAQGRGRRAAAPAPAGDPSQADLAEIDAIVGIPSRAGATGPIRGKDAAAGPRPALKGAPSVKSPVLSATGSPEDAVISRWQAERRSSADDEAVPAAGQARSDAAEPIAAVEPISADEVPAANDLSEFTRAAKRLEAYAEAEIAATAEPTPVLPIPVQAGGAVGEQAAEAWSHDGQTLTNMPVEGPSGDGGPATEHSSQAVRAVAATGAPSPATAREDEAVPENAVKVLAAFCAEGHPNPIHGPHCRVCGGALTSRTGHVNRPVLGMLHASDGTVLPIDGDIIIGRVPKSDAPEGDPQPRLMAVISPSKAISKSHCAVRLDDWDLSVEDLGSTNGTILMRPSEPPRRLTQHQRALLRAGDVIDLGDGVSVLVEA
ncbi:FHA domain-containing protein [Actinomyces marmotae]|uniref:FHA domain-containing protein n=1 Tax=Actinomyces marmotae TaxID=2737173 RepID=A0A6M8B3M4_9ACTO|nr:FHA domain-containing protein [Actinomyces marmotae]QKD79247.1 FHA domain-containing protein [Actinomyces marmotae]